MPWISRRRHERLMNHPWPSHTKRTAEQSLDDFERGARSAVEAFDAYFRTEDDVLFAGVANYREEDNADAGYDWRHYTDEEFEQFANWAIREAISDERRRTERVAVADTTCDPCGLDTPHIPCTRECHTDSTEEN